MIAKLNTRHKLLLEYFIYILYLKRINTNWDIFTAFQISVQECNVFILHSANKNTCLFYICLNYARICTGNKTKIKSHAEYK